MWVPASEDGNVGAAAIDVGCDPRIGPFRCALKSGLVGELPYVERGWMWEDGGAESDGWIFSDKAVGTE